jgi:hypothetical protein
MQGNDDRLAAAGKWSSRVKRAGQVIGYDTEQGPLHAATKVFDTFNNGDRRSFISFAMLMV